MKIIDEESILKVVELPSFIIVVSKSFIKLLFHSQLFFLYFCISLYSVNCIRIYFYKSQIL